MPRAKKSGELERISSKEWDELVDQVQDLEKGHSHDGTDSKQLYKYEVQLKCYVFGQIGD